VCHAITSNVCPDAPVAANRRWRFPIRRKTQHHLPARQPSPLESPMVERLDWCVAFGQCVRCGPRRDRAFQPYLLTEKPHYCRRRHGDVPEWRRLAQRDLGSGGGDGFSLCQRLRWCRRKRQPKQRVLVGDRDLSSCGNGRLLLRGTWLSRRRHGGHDHRHWRPASAASASASTSASASASASSSASASASASRHGRHF